ncbi:C6 transcription factor [Aspergillus luchuensis]|uniref:C6 transcription factor n=1 Tax=Aspergillus kawachii TaxID=1069201 RepID=A0A146F8V1_ASPKA|nr:C6 transcription factor [Aspergillus luchuensis]
MAISLGLHQEVLDPEVSEEDRNRRRRAWWSVYSLDRLLSVKSGNPITIHDEDIGTTWPQPTRNRGGPLAIGRPHLLYTIVSDIG